MNTKQESREQFLEKIDSVVAWDRLMMHRAALSKIRAKGQSPADAAGNDASGVFPPEQVCA